MPANPNKTAGIVPPREAAPALPFRFYPAYGIAGFGRVAVEVTLQLYLFDFYTRILGLSPLLAGAAFAVAILWDALSDLVVSAALFKGRQKGVTYSLVLWIGALLLAATTILLFSPIPGISPLFLFLHLLVSYVLVNTGMTLLDLPQTTLSSELTEKADERNKLLASRMGFGILGLALGSILPGLLLFDVPGEPETNALRNSRTYAAWILAALVLLTGTLTAFFVYPREKATEKPPVSHLPSLHDIRSLLRDRAYIRILGAGLVAAVGRTINAALALLYYRLVLNLGEDDVTRIIFPVFTASIILSIPAWIRLSRTFGKQRPAAAAVSALGLMGIIAYPVLPEKALAPVLLVSTLGGFLAGSVFLVDSMITDRIDADETKTGERKESLYFAIWKSLLKVARAVAFVAIGLGLEATGLDPSLDTAPQNVRIGIILLFGVFVGLCFVLSGYLLHGIPAGEFPPANEKRHS